MVCLLLLLSLLSLLQFYFRSVLDDATKQEELQPIEEEKKGVLKENRGRSEKRRSREQLDQIRPSGGQEGSQTSVRFKIEDIRSRFKNYLTPKVSIHKTFFYLYTILLYIAV